MQHVANMCYFSGFVVPFSECGQSRCSITLMDTRTFLVIHKDGLSFKSPRASAPNSQATCPVIPWSQTSTYLLSCPSCLNDIFVQYKVAFSTLKICCLHQLSAFRNSLAVASLTVYLHPHLACGCFRDGLFLQPYMPVSASGLCSGTSFSIWFFIERSLMRLCLRMMLVWSWVLSFLHIATKSVSLHKVLLFEWLF